MRSCTDHATCPIGEQPPGSASLLEVQPPVSGTEMGDGFPPISFLPCKLLMFPALNHWSHPSQHDSLSHCQNSLRIPTAAEFLLPGMARCVQVRYLLWFQGNFPGTRGHLGRVWALAAKGMTELSYCHQHCAIWYWPSAGALQALATKNRM